MSLEIWPPVAPSDRELKAAQALVRLLLIKQTSTNQTFPFPPFLVAQRARAVEEAPPVQIKMLIRAQERELAWATQEILAVCTELKRSLEDCYALLAPIDPGSTLVMSTPRNERVKGHITRVGTRIVKGVRATPFLLLLLTSLRIPPPSSPPANIPSP